MTAAFLSFVALVIAAVAIALLRYIPRGERGAALGWLAAWTLYASSVGGLGARFIRDRSVLPPLLVVPAIALVVFLGRSRAGARIASAMPAYALIGLAFYRVGVELFLHALARAGVVPAMLTYEGANFDILIGLSAPLVAWLLHTRRIGPRLAIAWNIVGVLMLLNVVVRSVLTAPGPLHLVITEVDNHAVTTFPYTFIPGFLAPLAMALHVLALRSLGRRDPATIGEPPVVLITGASRGIGRSIALAYARRRARLVLAARNVDALTSVQREAQSEGADVLISTTDVTDAAAVEHLVAEC